MRTSHTYAIAIALFSAAAVAASSGCADGETTNTTSTSTSTSTTSSSGTGGTTSGTGGGSTGGGGSSSSGTGGAGGGTGGSGGTGPDACLTSEATHVLINEVSTHPDTDEFIEIHNPGSAAVDLTNYYLSDNSVYHGIAAGDAWAPGGTPNTDFLVQFPPGTTIAAGEILVIEFGTDFEGTYSSCPDFTVRSGVTCNSNAVPQMVVPTNGGLGTNVGSLISNHGEMAMLFCWSPGYLVHDVDYVNWDAYADANTHVDKTNVTGYLPDTDEATQRAVAAPEPATNPNDPDESIGRCDDTEDDETATGGNGLLGHDETSETFNTSFVIITPSPGVANTCN